MRHHKLLCQSPVLQQRNFQLCLLIKLMDTHMNKHTRAFQNKSAASAPAQAHFTALLQSETPHQRTSAGQTWSWSPELCFCA